MSFICEFEVANNKPFMPLGYKSMSAGSGIFLIDSCTFPTEEITDVQNFNFLPKSPSGVFSAPHFVFLEENLQTIFGQAKI